MATTLAVLLIRFLALQSFLYAVLAIPSLIMLMFPEDAYMQQNMLPYAVSALSEQAIYLFSGLALWAFAPAIARRMMHGFDIKALPNLSHSDVMHLGLVLMGIFLVAANSSAILQEAPEIWQFIRKQAGAPVTQPHFDQYNLGFVFEAIFGVLMVLFSIFYRARKNKDTPS